MKMCYFPLLSRNGVAVLGRTLFLALLITPAFMAIGQGNTCPSLPGGVRNLSISTAVRTNHLYPSTLPPGSVTTGNLTSSTVGSISLTATKNAVYSLNTFTIHPTLGTGASGSVVLKFLSLEMEGTNAVINIYDGVGTSGPPLHTVSASNDHLYSPFEYTIEVAGPVTITFSSPTSGPNENFDVAIRYMTGDQTGTSAFSRKFAYWKDFITPDSYTIVDDLARILLMQYGSPNWGNVVPICVGYFDQNRNFVSSEVSLCIHHDRHPPSLSSFYPGRLLYTMSTRSEYDIDDNQEYNAADRLKSARLMYILANAPTSTREQALTAQLAVWAVLSGGGGYDALSDALYQEAETEVDELPNPPEPTFSITPPPSAKVPGSPLVFNINFDINREEDEHPTSLKLSISGNAVIGTVTGPGVTYVPATGVLTFDPDQLPAVAQVSVSSNTEETATLTAVYDAEDFWNINNLVVYESCNPDYQDFIGLSQKEIVYPFRQAPGTWDEDALPVSLARFEVHAEQYSVNLNWTTASEVSNSGFEIQRSADAAGWQMIGFVEAQKPGGKISGLTHYRFTDSAPLSGSNYYRLKQLDLDGKSEYSDVRIARLKAAGSELTIYPNPVVGGRATLRMKNANYSDVEVYNIAGMKVVTASPVNGELNLQGLPAGMYLLRAVLPGGEAVRKSFVIN